MSRNLTWDKAPRACANCSAIYTPKRQSQRYCCRRCNISMFNKRKSLRYATDPAYRIIINSTNQMAPSRQWEKRKDYQKQYQQRVRERRAKWARATYIKEKEMRPWRKIIHAARTRSKISGIPCDIDMAWAEQRWTGFCEMTLLPFDISPNRTRGNLFSPSIDRINPTLGYIKNNCRFILMAVNLMKLTGRDSDVYKIAAALMKNRPK